MGLDVLMLNSGEWSLAEEIPADPWHILVYQQRTEKRNELHMWLPRDRGPGSSDFAFRRFWVEGATRWCVEIPRPAKSRDGSLRRPNPARLRFTTPDGLVLWSTVPPSRKLAELSNRDLQRLRGSAVAGAFSP